MLRSRNNCLSSSNRLYGIVDQETCLEKKIGVVDFAKAFFTGGGEVLQYRDKLSPISQIRKNLELLLKETAAYRVNLILNDHPEIAREFGVAFHLGQEDISQKAQEKLPQSGEFWGLSTHNKEEIHKASVMNPNYIGFGSVFSGKTKKSLIPNPVLWEEVPGLWTGAIVFIGGITLENFRSLPDLPRVSYAVIHDFFRYGASPRNIEKYTREWHKLTIL